MARSVTSAEFVRQFGQLRHEALQDPVFVTHHGRPTHVLLDIDRYRRATQASDTDGLDAVTDTIEQLGAQLPEGLIICDADERITYANPTAIALLCRDVWDCRGQTLWEVLPETRGSVVEGYIRRTMETKEPARVDLPSLFRDGMWSHVESFPVGDGTGILWRDITDEVRYKRLADIKRAIMDAMDRHGRVGYARLSLRGAIERINDGLLSVLQLPRERVLHVAMADLVPTKWRMVFREALESVLQGGDPARIETALLANDGKTVAVTLVGVALRGLYGIEGAVVIATAD